LVSSTKARIASLLRFLLGRLWLEDNKDILQVRNKFTGLKLTIDIYPKYVDLLFGRFPGAPHLFSGIPCVDQESQDPHALPDRFEL
jgi:hypothetical protein